MKRINLVKYGFVRWPEEDFSDDGNRFTCFRAGKNVRVSKLVSNGEVYLSIGSTVGKGTLPHEVYCNLPNYNSASWKYNGVSIDSLTEQDLIDFYNACVSYEKEYEEAESSIKYPTLEEITAQSEKLYAKSEDEYKQASQFVADAVFSGAILGLSDYKLTSLRRHLNCLKSAINNYDPKELPRRMVGKSASFDFVKPTYCYLVHKSWYLEQIEKYIEKVKNN